MSRYSGKCDFKDEIEIFGVYDILKADVYVGDIGKIKFESEKDMIPYYPYIVLCMVGGNINNGNMVIHLSRESYIDTEEKEHRYWYLNDCLKMYRKCKREKKEFKFDLLDNEFLTYKNQMREIYMVVKEKGNKTVDEDINFVHFPCQNMYRVDLLNFAKEHGVDKHPLFFKVAQSIDEYKKMIEKYKGEDYDS